MRQVLRLLRGALYAGQGAEPDFVVGAGRSAAARGPWVYGDSTARAKRELLPRSRWKEELCRVAGGIGRRRWHPARALFHLPPGGFWTGYRRGDRRRAHALRPRTSSRAKRLDARAGCDAAPLHAGGISRTHQLDSGGAAGYIDYQRFDCWISRRDGTGI